MIKKNFLFSSNMTTGLIQLIAKGEEDKMLTMNPKITYFRYVYKNTPLFYRNDLALENIKINWDDNYIFNIDRNIHLLGDVSVKVTIPYFQITNTSITKASNIISNTILTKIIYDNYPTYMFLVENTDNVVNYYLIPQFLLFNNLSKYSTIKIPFSKIKQYFHSQLQTNIDDTESIYFLSFTDIEFINEVIPLLLKFGNLVDQYYINILTNEVNEQQSQNLLLPNSYDNYLENLVKNRLFIDYQTNNQFDKLSDYHQLSCNEIKFYYDKYKNSLYTFDSINLDAIRSYSYYLNNSFLTEESAFIKDAIIKNSLLLQYFIFNLNTPVNKTFTFYKKFDTVVIDIPYEYILTNDNIIPVDDEGNPLTGDDIPENKVSAYYPRYTIDIAKTDLNLGMTIKTIDKKKVTYAVSPNNIHSLTVSNPDSSYTGDNLVLIIEDPNRTENSINNDIVNTDYNLNDEWIGNIKVNFNNLDGNDQMESLLFNSFKTLYFLEEATIKQIFDSFPKDKNSITNLWIELRTYDNKFMNSATETVYDNVTTFNSEKELIKQAYSSIGQIKNYPQDIFNVYLLSLINFMKNIKSKYFADEQFITWFHNKIVNYFYMRYIRVSALKSTSITAFVGLLFYINLDMREYFSKDILRNYLLELFNMSSFIGHINFNDTELSEMKSFKLEHKDITNFTSDNVNSGIFDLDNTEYFHELKTQTKYTILSSDYTIEEEKLLINKNLLPYYNYHGSLTSFIININDEAYDISEYTLTSKNLILTMPSKYIASTITGSFILTESTKIQVPLLDLGSTSTAVIGEENDFIRISLIDKVNKIDKFITPSTIQISHTITSDTLLYIILTRGTGSIYYQVTLEQNDNGTYSFTGNPLLEDLLLNYSSFDSITLDIINLPTETITITDSDCIKSIKDTFPYIKLKTSSSVYDNTLLVTSNTFNTTGNKPIRFEETVAQVLNTDNSVKVEEHLKLLVLDDNKSTYVDSSDNGSISIKVFKNKYLPNMITYTTLNLNSVNQISMMDFFIQKPAILRLNTTNNLPVFLFSNIPTTVNSKRYTSHETYLNTMKISNVTLLNSNQIIRDNNSNYGDKIYSSHFDSVNVKSYSQLATIQDTILNELDNTMSSSSFNGKIIKIIEDSYNAYIISSSTIIDNIKNTDIYGDTINKVYNSAIELNEFNTISQNSKYKLSFMNYDLLDYDGYTILTPGFYDNFTTVNKYVYKFDKYVFYQLNKKFDYTGYTGKVFKSPWLAFNSDLRTSKTVNSFLENFSTFISKQFSYIDNNLVVNDIFNKANFKQEIITQDDLANNYIKLTHKVNTANVSTSNKSNYTQYINNTSDDIYTHVYYKNKKVDVDTVDSDESLNINTSLFPKYEDKSIYVESIVNNNHHKLHTDTYNLLGAVEVVDNKITLTSDSYTVPDYLIVNGHLLKVKEMIDDNITSWNESRFNGIQYNCQSIETTTFEEKIDNIIKLDDKIHYICLENTNLEYYLNEDVNYLVQIDNIVGVMKYVSGLLILYTNKQIILRNKLEIFYNETYYSDKEILDVLILNSKIVYYNNIVISDYTVVDVSSYDAYCEKPWSYSNYIFLDTSDKTIFQNYSDYIKFLDSYVLFNFIDSNTASTKSLNLYSVTTKQQPPLLIDKQSITRFNPLNDLNWIENKEHWLCINNTPFQVKDILNQTIPDGNYLLYYCPSSTKPNIRSCLDLYYDVLEPTNVSSMTLEPYKNEYLISKAFSELTFLHNYFDTTTPKAYKYYIYGTNNSKIGYYYPLSTSSLPNSTAYTFSEFSQTFYMPNDDVNTAKTNIPDSTLGLTQFTSSTVLSDDVTRLATNSLLIEEGNNLGIIKSVVTNDTNSTTTLVVEQDVYVNTDLVINKNNTLVTRPLTITNKENYYEYTLKNDEETDDIDSLLIISTTDAVASKQFLTKVIFESDHSSDVIDIKTNNDNIVISKNSNLNWTVSIKNSDKFDTTTNLNALNANKIVLDLYNNTTFKEKIILWVVISDIYPELNLITTTNSKSKNLTEPLYLSTDNKTQISIENDVNDDFYYVDSKYFTTDIAESDIIISSKSLADSVITSFKLYVNELANFTEIADNSTSEFCNFNIKGNTMKFIKSPLNTWDYLDSYQMNFKKILENTELLKNYRYYIFTLDDYLFFNERKSVDATTSAVELIYNITEKYNINYPFDITTVKTDVFVYNYEPIFIKVKLNCIVNFNNVYIYCPYGTFERNQIIKIWDNVMRILYYSNYHNAYVAYLMSSGHELPNNIDGYYSLGQLNNYLDRNYILKNNQINNSFHVKNRDLVHGDYYIDNNELKIYTGNTINDVVYVTEQGSHFNLLYLKENSISSFYYDPSQINLEVGMVLYYKYDSNTTYQYIINYIDNNQIFFIDSSINSSINSGTLLRVYLPIQEFTSKDINVQDNYVSLSNFNGWIETIDNNDITLHRVVNSYISNSINDGTYRVLDVENFDKIGDFSNNYTVDNDTSVNSKIPLKMSLDINYDIDGNIYFTDEDSFDFTTIQHNYYQQVLVNDNIMNITYVNSTKLYINKTLITLPIKYNSNNKYTVIISAGNVNNNFILSNRFKLSNNYFFTYPSIPMGNSDVNIIFKSYFDEVIDDKLKSFLNDFNYNIPQALLYKENDNIKIDSTEFTTVTNSSVWRDDIYKSFYIENYVPLSLSDTDNLYFEFKDSTFLPQFNNTRFIPYTTQKISGKKTSVIIEEYFRGERYLHYVDMVLINFNIPKIVSNNIFKSLEESVFYLNRVIPIRISNNKYIQLLNPEYVYNKEINNKLKETLEYYVYVKVKLNGIPVKSGTNWKYPLDITETKYNYMKNKNVYYSALIFNTNSVKEESGKYYLYSDRYIESEFTHLFFKQTNYINKITFTNTTLNSEYDNIDDSYFIDLINGNHFSNKYKSQSLLNIDYTNEEYHLSFKTNQPLPDTGYNKSTIVNFGPLESNYYVNKTNKISSVNIIGTDNKYTIKLTHDIYDITNKLSEYEIYQDVTNKSNNFVENTEINPSSRTMIELLKDKGINLSLILNNRKPWQEWSLVTLHHNSKFTNVIKDGIVYINGQVKYKSSVSFDTNNTPDKVIESRFTQNEVDMIKALLDSFYTTNTSNPEDEFNKFLELREIEDYIYKQLFDLTTQEYFWNNIDSIIKNLVENYNTTNGYNQWTFYQGCIMTNNFDVLEINEMGDNYLTKKDYMFEYDGTRYTRKYYLSSDFTINYYTTGLTDSTFGYYLGSTFFVVERDYSIINTEITNVINNAKATFYGNSIDNLVVFLKELYQYKQHLEPNKNTFYTFYLYGTPDSGDDMDKVGFYYPLSLKSYGDDTQYTFKEFKNNVFYLPNSDKNTATRVPPPVISGLIEYNKLKNVSYYVYYVYGTSNSGSSSGMTGYYYPLSLTPFGNDHSHTFDEFPNVTFYMPNEYTTHYYSTPPEMSLNLINYNNLYSTNMSGSTNVKYSTLSGTSVLSTY